MRPSADRLPKHLSDCFVEAKREEPEMGRRAALEQFHERLRVARLRSTRAKAVIGGTLASLESSTARFESSAVTHGKPRRRTGLEGRRHSAGNRE